MIQDIFTPLTKRPALCAFGCAAALFIMAKFPIYALAIMPLALFVFLHISRFLLKICLMAFVAAAFALLLNNRAAATYSLQTAESPPQAGFGVVETLLPRKNGIAVLLKTDYGTLRLTHKENSPPPLPGDSIQFKASYYEAKAATVPGAFDSKKWLTSQKLTAYGKLESFQILQSKNVPEQFFYKFRSFLKKRLSAVCGAPETGLLVGLLAGDKSGIPDALQNDFRRTGLVHVLAISGFHVVLLSGLLLLFLKALHLPHRIAKIIAVILLLIYIPITGGSAAVTRAVIMFSVVEIGSVLERKADSLNSLGVALLFIILHNPNELWNPGFQLSAAATAGIIIGQKTNPLKMLSKKFSKNKLAEFFDKNILQTTYVTTCATIATAPFLTYHFQTISPVAWFGNIIVVPLVSLSMYAGVFTLLSPIFILQQNFGAAAELFLRLAAWITKELSESPSAQLTIGPFPVPVLCLATLLSLTFPLSFKKPFYKKISIFLLSLLCCYLYIQIILFFVFPKLKITILDVEQADSILVETPQNTFLFDVGNGGNRDDASNKIIPYLRYRGIQELRAVVITHADADHYGGAASLIQNFPVREIWISECARIEPKEEWQTIIETFYAQKIPIRDISSGFYYREKYVNMQALHPQANATSCRNTNTESITFKITAFNKSILLTGDLTKEGEADILKTSFDLKSDILKLGHHGSKTSSSVPFLKAVQPLYAIASAGKKNRYRHPSQEILTRLDSMQIPVLNTAKDGSLFITIDKKGLTLESINGFLKYWRRTRVLDLPNAN